MLPGDAQKLLDKGKSVGGSFLPYKPIESKRNWQLVQPLAR